MENAGDVNSYIALLKSEVSEYDLTDYHAWYLATNYGKQADKILKYMKENKLTGEIGLAKGETWYGVNEEMVNSLEDFFVRRTGRLFFYIDSIHEVRDAVTEDMATMLEWNGEKKMAEINRLDEHLHDATHYYAEELAV